MTITNQNIENIYQNIQKNLSLNDQIRLAALLLNNISQKNITAIDFKTYWTEEDKQDIASFSSIYIDNFISEDEEESV